MLLVRCLLQCGTVPLGIIHFNKNFYCIRRGVNIFKLDRLCLRTYVLLHLALLAVIQAALFGFSWDLLLGI